MVSKQNICITKDVTGINKEEKALRSNKKKKRRKKLDIEKSEHKVDLKEKEILPFNENQAEGILRNQPLKLYLFSKVNSIKKDEVKNENEFERGSLNLDSLLSSYKQESNVQIDDPLAILSDEDEVDKKNQTVGSEQEVLEKDINEEIALKSNRFSRLFKKDRRDREKVRSAIIHKNEKEDEERAASILMPLLRVRKTLCN